MFRSARLDRRRRSRGTEINIAPLIDMMFILLIFFLLTTTFARETGVEVERPSAASAGSLEESSLRIAITASGAVWIDGEAVPFHGIRERVARFAQSEPNPTVVVIPDIACTAGRLVEVMDEAKSAGAASVSLATKKKQGRS